MEKEVKLKGIAAASGIAIGDIFLLDSEEIDIPKKKISQEELPSEIARFESALLRTREEILRIQKNISNELGEGHADIFNAHLLVLEDRSLIEEVISRLKKEKYTVEYIFYNVLKNYVEVFTKMEDGYLKERISDIDDVGKRVLRHLLGRKPRGIYEVPHRKIIAAYDLSPSDTATLDREKVLAFVTDIGSTTSHTAIMAKSLEIPAVVGLEEITQEANNGDKIIVDGSEGEVIVRPKEKTLREYETKKSSYRELGRSLEKIKDLPAQTKDGHKVILSANIEFPDEIKSVISHGSEGIGLYRTEYFYMNREDLPSEEEHYNAYKEVALKMVPDPVIIRTLDLGGDKFLSQLQIPHEMNPFMGWRAIRFCLARPDIFKVQLRAILRASIHGNLKLMYPMISGLGELRRANSILEDIKEELRKEDKPFDEDIEVGAMIEVPSAALTADLLAKEVDFFSIGTNDLIQYALAIDRVNEKIAYLYDPAHPAVLRLIKSIIDKGHQKGVWVGMCGEVAGDPILSVVLLGLELDEFSTSPVNLPEVKSAIRAVTYQQSKEIAKKVLAMESGEEVNEYLEEELKDIILELQKKK